MPKRSNDFQVMVRLIYEQMATSGVKVTESAMLLERDGVTEREVDILLDWHDSGTDLRLAVECRGRKDRDDIEWIDGLIGKYIDLPVDKVIAVSMSGFTPAASRKAAPHRIETLTLTKALETDWPSQFIRLGVAKLLRKDTASITVVTDPPLPVSFSTEVDDPEIITETGEVAGTIRQLVQSAYERMRPEIDAVMQEKCAEFLKTLEDVGKHPVAVWTTLRLGSQAFIKDRQGILRRVVSFQFQVISSYRAEPLPVEHYLLSGAQLTVAKLDLPDRAATVSVIAVQAADKPNQAKIHVQPVKSKKK